MNWVIPSVKSCHRQRDAWGCQQQLIHWKNQPSPSWVYCNASPKAPELHHLYPCHPWFIKWKVIQNSQPTERGDKRWFKEDTRMNDNDNGYMHLSFGSRIFGFHKSSSIPFYATSWSKYRKLQLNIVLTIFHES